MGSNRNLNPRADSTDAQSMADLKQYVGYIAAIVILALVGFFGWRYWQNHSVTVDTGAADQYSAIQQLNDKVVLAEQNPDLDSTAQQALATDRKTLDTQVDALVTAHPESVYAWQALLLKARQQADAQDYKGASESLKQALDVPLKDAGLKAMTQLRYATTLLAAGDVDAALTAASQELPDAFEPSKQELLGDIYLTQNKQTEAERSYENAWSLLINRKEERAILRLKMESIGLTPQAMPEQTPLVAVSTTPTPLISQPQVTIDTDNVSQIDTTSSPVVIESSDARETVTDDQGVASSQ